MTRCVSFRLMLCLLVPVVCTSLVSFPLVSSWLVLSLPHVPVPLSHLTGILLALTHCAQKSCLACLFGLALSDPTRIIYLWINEFPRKVRRHASNAIVGKRNHKSFCLDAALHLCRVARSSFLKSAALWYVPMCLRVHSDLVSSICNFESSRCTPEMILASRVMSVCFETFLFLRSRFVLIAAARSCQLSVLRVFGKLSVSLIHCFGPRILPLI